MVKAVALNSSPSMDNGNTALILNPFVEGLKEEGYETELFHTARLKINPCIDCGSCWTKTPGKCIHNDDMEQILPKMQQADIVVFAAPVYVDGMPGPMKNFIDRLLPLLEPFFELRDGHCRHPKHESHSNAKVVLVSNCGFWEMDNFDPLLTHMKAICKNAGWTYAGALLRPHGPALRYMLKRGYPVKDVQEAAKKAGKELARKGEMNEQTLQTVSRELVSLDMYVEVANQGFKKA